MEVLGKALTKFRRKAGLSKRGLAKKLDVSPNFIWRIEKGETKRWPSEEQLNKLADALNGYADEFRQAAGIVPQESKEILSKSQGLATTLGLIHERFVGMLKAKGLSRRQIDYVLENATEQTILDVVNGREPLDIRFGPDASELIAKHEAAGHQVLDLPMRASWEPREEMDDMLQVDALQDTPSSYLDSNKDAFLPETLSAQRRRVHRPRRETIDAGDARIVTNRPISREERSALEAIAEVIRQLLSK
jgi:transcriptional regulator with XRE-family HTH domain